MQQNGLMSAELIFDKAKRILFYTTIEVCYRLFIKTLKNHINLANGHPMTPLRLCPAAKRKFASAAEIGPSIHPFVLSV